MTNWKYNVYSGKELHEFLKKYKNKKLTATKFVEGCNLIYKCVLEIKNSEKFKENEDVQLKFDNFIHKHLRGCAIIGNDDPTDELVTLGNSEYSLLILGYGSFDIWINVVLKCFLRVMRLL